MLCFGYGCILGELTDNKFRKLGVTIMLRFGQLPPTAETTEVDVGEIRSLVEFRELGMGAVADMCGVLYRRTLVTLRRYWR